MDWGFHGICPEQEAAAAASAVEALGATWQFSDLLNMFNHPFACPVDFLRCCCLMWTRWRYAVYIGMIYIILLVWQELVRICTRQTTKSLVYTLSLGYCFGFCGKCCREERTRTRVDDT
jgi:hypothetical protein